MINTVTISLTEYNELKKILEEYNSSYIRLNGYIWQFF